MVILGSIIGPGLKGLHGASSLLVLNLTAQFGWLGRKTDITSFLKAQVCFNAFSPLVLFILSNPSPCLGLKVQKIERDSTQAFNLSLL